MAASPGAPNIPSMERTLKDRLASAGPEAWSQTLESVAERVARGEDLKMAVREFLDEFALRPQRLREAAIASRPPESGSARCDALLGALAEHLAASNGLPRPDWSTETGRFLDRFWFWSAVPGFRAVQIATSPAAFRRRGIFISPRALERI